MRLPKDLLSETYRTPKVILCQTNKDKICQLDVTDLQGTFKFNGYSEISFNVASVYHDLISGEQKRTPYYDYIEGLRLVYLEGFGYFQLQDPELYSDGIQEYKSINAYSLEYSLSQRYLETFIINMGDAGDTIGSIDGVTLYNPSDVERSLLHLVLQKAYGWTIGHVDDELASQGRSFEVDRESIYDFIMNDMCDTFQCYVEFDTINNTINVYSENEIERFTGDGTTNVFTLSSDFSDTSTVAINGHETTQYQYNNDTKELTLSVSPAQGDIIEITNEFKSKYDTDVVIAFENLSNEMRVNYSADDIKTVLTVKGADDLDIRNVNFGLPSIMNLDYYCTPEWMGDKLYNEYLLYMDKQDKYMSGFYSEDITGSTEETFNVIATKEDFTAGNVQEFVAKGASESFNANGNIALFNIDKVLMEFEIESAIEEHELVETVDTFTEPEMQVETITGEDTLKEIVTVYMVKEPFTHNLPSDVSLPIRVKLNDRELLSTEYQVVDNVLTINISVKQYDEIKIISYKNTFILNKAFSDDSVVYMNDVVINNYEYSAETNELVINDPIPSKYTITINTPLGKIQKAFQLSVPSNKVTSVKVDENVVNDYLMSTDGGTLTITDTSILKYGSVIVIKTINDHFTLINVKDRILSIKVNNVETDKYTLQNNILMLTSNDLHNGDIVSVESIDINFDLSQHKNKKIVSVFVNQTEIYSPANYNFDASKGLLTITDYNLQPNDLISIRLVVNDFIVTEKKDRILFVKIDSENILANDYSFDNNTGILTIADLDSLFLGEQLELDSVDEYFTLSQTKDKITSVIVDGNKIGSDEFSYLNNKLVITSKLLGAKSNIIVKSVDNHFYPAEFDGDIDSISIDGNIITLYTFNKADNILIINDNRLQSDSIVSLKTINNKFYLPNVQNVMLTSVMINGIPTTNYTFVSGILIISDKLHVSDIVSVEYIDNHFVALNEVGLRHIVQKSTDNIHFETIPEGKDGYEYDNSTKTLTINVPLKNGDKIRIRTIDSANALLIVGSSAKDGQILIDNVIPTLKSYTPKIGDYVIKIDGYTEILKELYQLIDNRLTEENSVPDEYKITEIKLNPDNFDEADKFLPEASIENLGEVYKIINQDKVEENGTITYNDIAYKYYVCEMRMSTYVDENGKEQRQYKYSWNERDLVFGGNGINALKEQIDVYSSVNDVQIAAEWDQKQQDSDEYKSYIDNLNKLQKTKEELAEKQKSVEDIAEQIQEMQNTIQLISEDININKNFSPDSLDRLLLFLREDEYSDDCFCTTEIDTDLDIINTQKELLVAGYKKLKTISRPTLSFSASMKNIYAIPEFEPILHQFKLGNFIKVRIRKDYIKKARLLEVQLNFEDLSNFSCTFGDLLSAKDQGDLHADLLAQAVSAGKAVASGSSYWQKGYDVATAIDEKIRQGLIDATTSIRSSSAGQDVSWDNYGIHLRKIVDGVLDNHEGWITNNKFLYSDDNFKTTKSVFGNYTINGETYWGILAGCVKAGLIEGSHIIGGEICIGEQEDGTYAFKVDKDGTVTMNKGDAADKLSYFSFDGDNGLIVGENKNRDYFSRVSAQRIEFCRKARIITVTSEPTHKYDNYDYILYQHTEGTITYFDYYKNPEFLYKAEEPTYESRAIGENFIDPEIKFGIPITYFANDTAYMKQAEIEGSLKVGTIESTPCISLGSFKLQIESNGSLSIVAT